MLYYSTNHQSPKVSFKQATIHGQAPDGGLYFPEKIPTLSPLFLKELKQKSKAQIGFEVIRPYVGGTIADEDLFQICEHTVNFDFPLVEVSPQISSLELFHGPTLAFKDVGARFMSRCLSYFSKNELRKVTVLVATSGDTGSAVANGFLGVEGVEVIILYPSGKVSKVQELQLTTLGQNIKALEVKGTFDDCQQMVKQAFADEPLNRKKFLTSANSINVARWLPQQFYYFFALQQWQEPYPPVLCVPSGNFGNIAAGLLAAVSGLPVSHFVAACNSNKVFTDYLQNGKWEPQPTVATISNAMDVGKPSNFVRILEMFGGDLQQVKKMISSYSITDAATIETISRVYQQCQYTLDPHGAVAYAALEKYIRENHAQKGILLETAHPVKFENTVAQATGNAVAIPEGLKNIFQKQKQSELIEARYEALWEILNQSAL